MPRPLYRHVPPLRENNQPDARDAARVKWVWEQWRSQDSVLYARDRQIEENVRMLAGQHWHFYSERLGRFVDVGEFLTEDERRWRQRPVLNRLILWFLLTHARMTENPPIIGFIPGPDRMDAELAETLDVLCKTIWREADMTDTIDRLAAWLLPGGQAFLMSRIDMQAGPWREWIADAVLPLVGPDGGVAVDPRTGQPIQQRFPDVPHDAQGQPAVQWTPQGLQPVLGPDGQPVQPHSEREGKIVVDVLSPLEVRGQWGPQPWHQKRWHARLVFLTPEEIQETFGVEVEADPKQSAVAGAEPGLLDRVLFGAGYYGAAEQHFRGGQQSTGMGPKDGLVRVLEWWERPCQLPGMEERKDRPGGRYLAATHDTVLRDGQRPAAFPHVSPIRCFDFMRLPGRHGGTSLQEFLNSPQRASNRLAAHEMEHVALQAHPKGLVARGSGLENHTITNKPGEHYIITPQQGMKALEYVAPPPLNSDLYRTQGALLQFMTDIGNTQPSPGEVPTRDASGELVKELRWDRDRFLGPTMRRMVEELARMFSDWRALMPFVFSTERLISYAGEDNIPRTLMVRPHLFIEGQVNVVPDVESMFPEGRGEKQQRAYRFYTDGLFGPPGSPDAINRFFEIARFPHLSRAAKPGGVHRTTAEQNLGAVLQGTLAAEIPIYPWYDLGTHLAVYEQFMAAPEFKKLPPDTQGQLVLLWQIVSEAHQQQMMAQMAREAAMMGGGPPPPGPRSPRGAKPKAAGRRDMERAALRSRPVRTGPTRAGDNRPPTLLPESQL